LRSRLPPKSSSTPNSSDAAAVGTAKAQPTADAGQIDCSKNQSPADSESPSTSTATPAIDAATPPQREGCPASATCGPASSDRGAPHAAQRASSPRRTIGARWPHRGHSEAKGEPVKVRLAYRRLAPHANRPRWRLRSRRRRPRAAERFRGQFCQVYVRRSFVATTYRSSVLPPLVTS